MVLQLDVGKIKFQWQGNYDAATDYYRDDVVYHDGSAWVCVKANDPITGLPVAVTGVTPATSATASWNKMAQGSDLGSISGLVAGDLIYYDGSVFQRVDSSAGTHSSIVNRPSGPIFKPQGVIQLQHKNFQWLGRFSTSNSANTYTWPDYYYDNTAWVSSPLGNSTPGYWETSITPKFSDSVIKVDFNWYTHGQGHYQLRIMRWDSVSQTYTRPSDLDNLWSSAVNKHDYGRYSSTSNGADHVYDLPITRLLYIDENITAGVEYRYVLQLYAHSADTYYINYNNDYYNNTYSYTATSRTVLEEINNGA